MNLADEKKTTQNAPRTSGLGAESSSSPRYEKNLLLGKSAVVCTNKQTDRQTQQRRRQ